MIRDEEAERKVSSERPRVVEIRAVTPSDLERTLAVVEQAFGSPVERELVRMIRESSNYVPELSLVAESDGEIIGHVMLSYAQLHDDSKRHRILTLSPVSVIPQHQRKGVGSSLIGAALHLADQRGEPLVCLEGSPKYYGKLGFQDSRKSGIYFDLPDWAPPNAGQIYKLSSYDPTRKGKVVYPSAFAAAEELRSRIASEQGKA